MTSITRTLAFASILAVASGCAARPPVSAVPPSSASVPAAPRVFTTVDDSPAVLELLAARDRTPADRAEDGPRRSAELLTYLDLSRGMNVAQIAAGDGYMTELLARSIGHDGLLFAENPPSVLKARGLVQTWEERLARPYGARAVRLDSEIGAPLPAHVLDLVYVGDDLGDLGGDGARINGVATTSWYMLRDGGRLVLLQRDRDTAGRAAIEGCGFRLVSEAHLWDDGRVAITFVKP